jgi:alkylated DNA repair protein (DNA oxidative demethylase)
MAEQLSFGLGGASSRPGDDAGAVNSSLGSGATLLSALALPNERQLLLDIEQVALAAPFRHMRTPGGLRMSVSMTNCGELGWISDRNGYRYSATDPEAGRAWPAMSDAFRALATTAAARAGFNAFEPDACLVNCYEPGARLTLHQDKDERDFSAPIVSVSLGLPATFLFGGTTRAGRPTRIPLTHGDVVVWGGTARLNYHGVSVLAPGAHALLGARRINLTFRKAG